MGTSSPSANRRAFLSAAAVPLAALLFTREKRNHRSVLTLHDEDEFLMSESDAMLSYCARAVVLANDYVPRRRARIAVVGGGLCVIPRLLWPRGVDVYEIREDLVAWCRRRWPMLEGAWSFVVGDYRDTFPSRGPYDLVVFDIPEEPAVELAARLADDGVLLLYRHMTNTLDVIDARGAVLAERL